MDTDNNRQYAIHHAAEKLCVNARTLADVLRDPTNARLNRVQRYSIALTLASSYLQLHSTPWTNGQWTPNDIYLSIDQGTNGRTTCGDPYLVTRFDTATGSATRDRSFSTLGIVLLELCFGRCLEEHELWQQPNYAPLQSDPMMRQTVAVQWLEDVQGEAGDDWVEATEWTLRKAPTVLKDDTWRMDFAEHVVQPLQRCCESMNPRRGKP